MTGVDYNSIGQGYTATRRPDPRIAAVIWRALGDARNVLNVGAGAGAYEPEDRDVVAVEPSAVMTAQRPPRATKVVQAEAEDLPFDDGSFDAVMAVLSDHHWRDRPRGFAELRRVARRRVVLFNFDPAEWGLFWLTTEYLPSFVELIPERYRTPGVWESELRKAFGDLTLVPVPIPHDCLDGFYGAFWRRPAAYLDATPRFDPGSRCSRGWLRMILPAGSSDSARTSRRDTGARTTQICWTSRRCISATTSRSQNLLPSDIAVPRARRKGARCHRGERAGRGLISPRPNPGSRRPRHPGHRPAA